MLGRPKRVAVKIVHEHIRRDVEQWCITFQFLHQQLKLAFLVPLFFIVVALLFHDGHDLVEDANVVWVGEDVLWGQDLA